MKKIQKISAGVLACAMLLSVTMAGCGDKTSQANDSAGNKTSQTDASAKEAGKTTTGKIHIEMVSKGFQHAFWQAVKKGADEQAKKEGVEINFVGPANETATEEQLQQLNNAVNKNPNAIGLAALDTKALLSAIQTAQSKKIPIVGFDSGVPDAPKGAIVANASTNNIEGGKLAADELYKRIEKKLTPDKKVRIGVCSQELSSQSITQRTTGFIDEMVKKIEAKDGYGKGTVAVVGHDVVNNKIPENKAKVIIQVAVPPMVTDEAITQAASTILTKPDLIAAYGSNEMGAKGLLLANETKKVLGNDKVICVGFDSGEQQLDAVKNGIIAGSVTQDPVNIGRKTVELCVKAAKGEPVQDVDTGCKFYTKDNMNDPSIKDCLYK